MSYGRGDTLLSPRSSAAGSVRKAVILAAGMGRRLRPMTDRVPKPLLPVNGMPILENALRSLSALGLADTTIVVGHLAEQIRARFPRGIDGMRLRYVTAPDYATTNNIVSLWRARDELDQDCLLIEGDVFFEPEVLRRVLESGPRNAIAVSPFEPWMTGAAVTLGRLNLVTSLVLIAEGRRSLDSSTHPLWKTASIHVFTRDFLQNHFLPEVQAAIESGKTDYFYERILAEIIHRGEVPVFGAVCEDLKWKEVDDFIDFGQAQLSFFDSTRPPAFEVTKRPLF